MSLYGAHDACLQYLQFVIVSQPLHLFRDVHFLRPFLLEPRIEQPGRRFRRSRRPALVCKVNFLDFYVQIAGLGRVLPQRANLYRFTSPARNFRHDQWLVFVPDRLFRFLFPFRTPSVKRQNSSVRAHRLQTFPILKHRFFSFCPLWLRILRPLGLTLNSSSSSLTNDHFFPVHFRIAPLTFVLFLAGF